MNSPRDIVAGKHPGTRPMAGKPKIMPMKLRSPAASFHITALLALVFACNSAVADGYLILDGGTLGDELTRLDGRVPGRLYIGTNTEPNNSSSVVGMLILDVAGALPSDPGPRLTTYAFPAGSPLTPAPIVAPDGSFFGLDSSAHVVRRDAAGVVIYTSPPVAEATISARAFALQSDGKVLIAGARDTGGTRRFNIGDRR